MWQRNIPMSLSCNLLRRKRVCVWGEGTFKKCHADFILGRISKSCCLFWSSVSLGGREIGLRSQSRQAIFSVTERQALKSCVLSCQTLAKKAPLPEHEWHLTWPWAANFCPRAKQKTNLRRIKSYLLDPSLASTLVYFQLWHIQLELQATSQSGTGA